MTKLICDKRCEGRCFGPGPYDCCNSQCLAGCNGPSKNDCFACKKLRITKTNECVEACPRIQTSDHIDLELVLNPDGLYQHGLTW